MNSRAIFRSSAAALTVATLLTASPALAAFGTDTVKCRTAVAKSYNKLLDTAAKTIAACHKNRDKAKVLPAVDCNDVTDTVNVDSKLKFSKAVTKHGEKVVKGCTPAQDGVLTAAQSGGGVQLYVSCPVTCADAQGSIDTMAEVAACQGCVAASVVNTASAATLGMPAQPLSKEDAKCHGAIAKGFGKYFTTALKEEQACQSAQDGAGDNALTVCTNSAEGDPKLKASKAKTKANDGTIKACVAPANLANLDGCSAVSVAALNTCTATAWETAEDEAFLSTYEMEPTICPSAVRTTIRAGCSTNGSVAGNCSSGFQTGTSLSLGWKGTGHGVDLPDFYTLAGGLTCPGTEEGTCAPSDLCGGGNVGDPTFGDLCANNGDCLGGNICGGGCTVTGISADNPQYTDFTRCLDNPSIPCTNPFGNDAVNCPGSTACRYFLGPPLAVAAGGAPTCSMNVLNTNITGTANPENGESTLNLDLRARVATGVSRARPCPICVGDLVPQDGLKEGRCKGGDVGGRVCAIKYCNGGANDGLACTGQAGCPSGTCEFPGCTDNTDCAGSTCETGHPCDIQGFDLNFAPTAALNPTNGSSLDCYPNPSANISGTGLKVSLPLTTGISTKPAADPCESPNQSLNCFCGVCSGDGTQTCNSDTECGNLGLGTCESGSGEPRAYPNNCSDLTCSPVMGQTDRGECSTAPDTETYCSGLLFSNGRGVLACANNADCESYEAPNPANAVCPGNDCGSCSVLAFRSCFLDPIVVEGVPDVENPTLAGTFCLPPSLSGSVNSTTGTPGPGAVKADAIVEKRY